MTSTIQITAEGACATAAHPCAHACSGNCSPLVHACLTSWRGQSWPAYRGLFGGTRGYPVLEGEDARAYLSWYLPLHLPQVREGIRAVLPRFGRPALIRVLDLGAGAGTVAMALDQLATPAGPLYVVDTLEASTTFNGRLHDLKNALNPSGSVAVGECIHAHFEEWFSHAEACSGRYDWITIANFLSGISGGRGPEATVARLHEMLRRLVGPGGSVLLTIVEGGMESHCRIGDCLRLLQSSEPAGLRFTTIDSRWETVDASYLLICRHFQTLKALCRPNARALTILVERVSRGTPGCADGSTVETGMEPVYKDRRQA